MFFKVLIFLGLLAVTLAFTLPGEHVPGENVPDVITFQLVDGKVVSVDSKHPLSRHARSPQGSMSGTFEHSRRDGSSANLDYNHRLSKNLEVYGGAGRNFRYNDNNAHAGLRYRF